MRVVESTLTPRDAASRSDNEKFAPEISTSVGAGVGQSVGRVVRVIRATETVIVIRAAETTSSNAEVMPAESSDVTSAEATDVGSAKAADAATTKTSDVTSAKATDVAATEAAHVAAAEAAHVAAAAKSTTVSTATAAAAGFCTGGNKAAGKQCACQNHYQSSSHDISPLGWADLPPQDLHQMSARLGRTTPTSR
jgi:hypothetical protein